MNCVYILMSGSAATYIGATNDPDHRLRQHNRELVGGAKATAGRHWTRAFYIAGFPDWRTTLQFEWAWKHHSRKVKGCGGIEKRLRALEALLACERPTSKAEPFASYREKLSLMIPPVWTEGLEKIEAGLDKSADCGRRTSDNPSSNFLSNIFPFQMSSNTAAASVAASSSVVSQERLINMFEAAMESNVKTQAMLADFIARLNKMGIPVAPAAAPAAPAAGKGAKAGKGAGKEKKPRAKKEKEPLPEPEEGVIRFAGSSEGMYRGFNNFFKAPFTVDGKDYMSIANYFNSQKFAGSDDAFAEEIRGQKNPALTRAKAANKDHPARADWAAVKVDVMRRGLVAKFSQNAELRTLLLSTGEAPIEATQEDEMATKGYWSIGADGNGENMIGELLEEVRDIVKGMPAPAPAAACPAPAAAKPKPAPKAKPAAKPAAAAADSDDEEEAPVKGKKALPPAKPVAAAPAAAAADDTDSEEDEDEEDEE
jgi:ribA/ribD-fused uncharacterized protein